MCTINEDHMIHGSSDMKHNRHVFCNFGSFLPFYPTKNPKSQNFERKKKTPGDITIVNKCTKNHDHMLYCSWDMANDGFNYFSFWAISVFSPFTTITAWKIQIYKKWKKTWIYHHFTQLYQKSWSYAILFLRYGAWRM